jgi:hypothetical protein
MLADIGFGEAELVGEQERLAILAQRCRANPCRSDGSASVKKPSFMGSPEEASILIHCRLLAVPGRSQPN